MEDLIQSQIHESCKLALPEGLKELMCDISREVLRAQPQDLYEFITKYLGSLLKAREALVLASLTCSDVCGSINKALLDNYTTGIDLKEEDVNKISTVMEMNIDNKSVTTWLKERNFDQVSEEAIEKTLQQQNLDQLHTELLYIFPKGKRTASTSSLAGSQVDLPERKPYSVHDNDSKIVVPDKPQLISSNEPNDKIEDRKSIITWAEKIQNYSEESSLEALPKEHVCHDYVMPM